MLVLVDYQVIPTTTRTMYIYGLYNTDDNAIYYYKVKELERFIKDELKRNPKFKIQGIKNLDNVEAFQVERMNGIEFITGTNSYRTGVDCKYVEKNNVLVYSLSYDIETIYTKPLKIGRYTSSMTIWYQGLRFQYKDADKNKRAAGFNLECSIAWKDTKNYFYVNNCKVPLISQTERFIKLNWPSYMTQDYFTKVLNNFQQYYTLTAFYRCNLPYCKELDLSQVNTKNITSLRNCFWHNKSLEKVSFAGLNLDNITDFYWPFQDDKNLQYIDFRGCVGDIQLFDKLLLDMNRLGDSTCLIFNKHQPNFVKMIQSISHGHELVNIKSIKDIPRAKEFVVASTKLMTGELPTLFFVCM